MKIKELWSGELTIDRKMIAQLFILIFAFACGLMILCGFIAGYMIADKQIFDYLGWYKINTDCDKCQGYMAYNCMTPSDASSFWDDLNGEFIFNASNEKQ